MLKIKNGINPARIASNKLNKYGAAIWILNKNIPIIDIIVKKEAWPSIPSIILKALVNPTIAIMVNGRESKPKSNVFSSPNKFPRLVIFISEKITVKTIILN